MHLIVLRKLCWFHSYMQTQEVEIKPCKSYVKSDSEMLDEVVVVAYGTASRQSITGAVASIDSKIRCVLLQK